MRIYSESTEVLSLPKKQTVEGSGTWATIQGGGKIITSSSNIHSEACCRNGVVGGGGGVTLPSLPSYVTTEPVLLNVYGAPELMPRNEFRQPM